MNFSFTLIYQLQKNVTESFQLSDVEEHQNDFFTLLDTGQELVFFQYSWK